MVTESPVWKGVNCHMPDTRAGTFRLALIAAEGIIANLLLGTLFIWSVMRNPLLELFPQWTEGMLSVVFGFHNLFTSVGILLGGFLSARISSRKIFLLLGILVFLGLGGFTLLPVDRPGLSYAMVIVLFWLFAAVGIGLGISAVQSTTIPWFPRHSGLISGALYMALGMSSVLLAALAEVLLPAFGVRHTMLVFGLIVLVVVLLILLDRRSILPPQAAGGTQAAPLTGFSPREMLRSPVFWILILWNISLRSAGLTLLDHAASMFVAYGGTAIVAMLISPANGLGSLCIGMTMDRLGIKSIMKFAAGLMCLAGMLLLLGDRTALQPLLLAGLLVGGLAYGGSSSSYSAAVKNIFGPKYYARNFGISNIAMGLAAIIESASGFLLDAGGGSYTGVLLMVFLLSIPAIVCSLLMTKRNVDPALSV